MGGVGGGGVGGSMGYNVFTEYLLDMIWLNTRQDKTRQNFSIEVWHGLQVTKQ